jgi:multidrug resistance efflux pump
VVQANAQADRAVPKALVMQRRFELRKAELQVEQSQHEHDIAVLTAKGKQAAYDAAADQIKRRQIIAPISGLIIEVSRKTGEWVRAGDPVLRVVRMDQLRIQGTVKATEFNRAEIMNRPVPVQIALAHGRIENFPGKITFANPLVEGDGTYSVWAEFPNRQEGGEWLLQPGLPASMTVHLNPVANRERARAAERLAAAP